MNALIFYSLYNYNKGIKMKKLILTTVLYSSSIIASDITVEITNLLNKNGNLSIGLYNKNDDTFSKISQYYKGINLKIHSDKEIYTFKNIPNGVYAISTIHDENENKKLDKNFLGIPTEGYGFSNNIRPMFRGANFEESKFVLNSDKTITIKMGY
jgi:uncharacterized protein (DUF2141 family)